MSNRQEEMNSAFTMTLTELKHVLRDAEEKQGSGTDLYFRVLAPMKPEGEGGGETLTGCIKLDSFIHDIPPLKPKPEVPKWCKWACSPIDLETIHACCGLTAETTGFAEVPKPPHYIDTRPNPTADAARAALAELVMQGEADKAMAQSMAKTQIMAARLLDKTNETIGRRYETLVEKLERQRDDPACASGEEGPSQLVGCRNCASWKMSRMSINHGRCSDIEMKTGNLFYCAHFKEKA